MYGDASFADLIADNNGYRVDDVPQSGLTPGLTLQMPNIVRPTHNWEGVYPVYNPAAIVGGMYPNMPMPARHMPPRYVRFLHVLIEAAVYAAVFATGQGLVAGALEKAVSVIVEKIVSAAMGATLAGIAQQETAIALGDQKEFSWTAVGLGALTAAVTAGFSNGLKIDAAKATDFGSYAHKLVQNIELTIAIQGLSFATGQQNHFSWREALASLASTIANVSVNQLDMDSEALSDALTTTSATMATLGVSKIIGGDFNLEATIANTLGTVIGNQLAYQAKQHYTEYQAEARQTAEFKHELADLTDDYLQSVKYRPDEHGVFSSSKTPTAPPSSKQSSAPKRPKPAAKKATAHDAPYRNAHLQKDHAKQEARMTRAGQRADARNTITGSGYGFWDNGGRNTSNSGAFLPEALVDPQEIVHSIVSRELEGILPKAMVPIVMGVADSFNPFVTLPNDIREENEALRAGEFGHALRAKGKMVLDSVVLLPVLKGIGTTGKVVFNGVGTAVKELSLVSKVGVFGSKGRIGAERGEVLLEANSLKRTHNLSGKSSSRNVADIANDMRTNGYSGPPIDVVKDKIGNMYIIDGHHRAAAARITSTQVKVNIVTDIVNHPSSYESIEEVINDALLIGRDKLRLMK